MPSTTKATMKAAIDDAIDNATSNSSFLSDQEQADVLNAVIEAIENHCYVINPNCKPFPSIKIKT